MTGVAILVIAVLAALGMGLAVRTRWGTVRHTGRTADSAPGHFDADAESLLDAGLRLGTPTVLHFSADWCGPCAAVRRVVAQVVDSVDSGDHTSRSAGDHTRQALDLELDVDEFGTLSRRLGVLSLPTTFVYDANLSQVARISGVPNRATLRQALIPLLRPEGSSIRKSR